MYIGYANGYTGESPSGYFGNLDVICINTTSLSFDNSLEKYVSYIHFSHASEKWGTI